MHDAAGVEVQHAVADIQEDGRHPIKAWGSRGTLVQDVAEVFKQKKKVPTAQFLEAHVFFGGGRGGGGGGF